MAEYSDTLLWNMCRAIALYVEKDNQDAAIHLLRSYMGAMYSLTGKFETAPKPKCICNLPENANKAVTCPQHGHQYSPREICPECGNALLGYCPQGEYCTSEACHYVA